MGQTDVCVIHKADSPSVKPPAALTITPPCTRKSCTQVYGCTSPVDSDLQTRSYPYVAAKTGASGGMVPTLFDEATGGFPVALLGV